MTKKTNLIVLCMIVLAFPIVAFAQGGSVWGEELTINIFGITLIGSVMVAAVVAKLKQWLKVSGWLVTFLAFLVGTAIGALTYLGNLLFEHFGVIDKVMPVMIYLIQGFFSGGIAAGLWKATKELKNGKQKK